MKISTEKINFPDGLVGEINSEPEAGYFFVNNTTRQYFNSKDECVEALHDFLKNIVSKESESRLDNSESSSDSDKYVALKTIIGLISFLGFIIIAGGFCALVYMFLQDNKFFGIAALVGSIVVALPLLAFSNMINVFIDIEHNTRQTRKALNKLLNK